MNTAIANNKISANSQNTAFNQRKHAVKTKSDSMEFLSGVFYIIKKVFALR